MNQKTKKESKEKKISRTQQRTAQQSIPYELTYPNGMFMLSKGVFSKSYAFDDMNFVTEDEDIQKTILKKYSTFLSKFGHNITTQFTILNRKMGLDKISEKVKLASRPGHPDWQVYRDEYNNNITERLKEGNNDIVRQRFFTATLKTTDVIMANRTFELLDKEIEKGMRNINNGGVAPLTTEERLHILYDIYRSGEGNGFDEMLKSYRDEMGHLSLPALKKTGRTTKDLIAVGMKINPNDIIIGQNVARSYIVSNLPASLDTSFLSEITNIPCVMIASVNNSTLPRNVVKKKISAQSSAIKADMAEKSNNAINAGYDPSLISEELQYTKDEATYLMQDITIRNQKVFFTTVYITLIAPNMDELKKYEETLKMRVSDFMCQLTVLTGQQMLGFKSSLPFAQSHVAIDYMLSSESIAALFPFSVQELMDEGGTFYGINDITKNMLIYNRRRSALPHGLVFGKSGSGKSYYVKGEMIPIILNSDDDLIAIDPDGEYVGIAHQFNGTVIEVALGSQTHINPLDMDINYAAEKNEDPIGMKLNFLVDLCECIVGSYGMDSFTVNVIHKAGRKMYQEYMEHMETLKGTGITCDAQACPTLVTFWNELIEMEDPYAHTLAQSIEQYCKGTYDIFAHRTNVDSKSRIVVYDISKLPSQLKELAMRVCFNDIWNRMVQNRIGGKKNTWVYVDEFYLLARTESSAKTLQEYVKRSRKYGGIITLITQDILDVMTTAEGQGILGNCGFVVMMNQSKTGRDILQDQYSISSSLMDYVKDQPPGRGLLYNGATCIPFDYTLPDNTQLHKLMSTKFGENNAA